MTAQPAIRFQTRESEWLVSVIIPSYKMGRFIGEALDSIGKQSYGNWEVIAVDDCGPKDGTREAVEKFAVRHPGNRIEYHRMEENSGVSAARNTGIRLSQGKLLAFLDPDDWWPCGYLEAQLANLESGGEGRMSFCAGKEVDGAGQETGSVFSPGDTTKKGLWKALCKGNCILPSGSVIWKSCFEEIGLFDENREIQHLEDWDAWLRLIMAGKEICFLPSCHFYWRRHEGSASKDFPVYFRRAVALRGKHCHNAEFLAETLRYMCELENSHHQYYMQSISPRQLGVAAARLVLDRFRNRLKRCLNR